MQPSQQALNPWLVSYIQQNHSTKSRYEIDRYLIETGHNPVEIEAVWKYLPLQVVEQHPPLNDLRPIKSWEIIFSLILLALLVGIYTLWPLVSYGLIISLPLAIASLLGTIGLAARRYQWEKVELTSSLGLTLLHFFLYVATIVFFLNALISLLGWDKPTEVSNISVGGHVYHLTYSDFCTDTCSNTLKLYRCDFFNLICPEVGSVTSHWPESSFGESQPLSNVTNYTKLRLGIDSFTNQINVLEDEKLIYTFVSQ